MRRERPPGHDQRQHQYKSRLTGERPQQGVTPDSLLALHEAGYRAILERIGDGRILDVGCGQGFESARFLGPDRQVVGRGLFIRRHDDRRRHATAPRACEVAQMDALDLGLATASFDGACSSHLIEHFTDPEPHVAELARVVKDDGTLCLVTPNGPTDFENPFHLHLFDRAELEGNARAATSATCGWGASTPPPREGRLRGAPDQGQQAPQARRLRPPPPHAVFWYVWAYTRILPLVYKVLARGDSGGLTGITADDWFVTDEPDETTLVLFAVARKPPRRDAAGAAPPRCWRSVSREASARASRPSPTSSSSGAPC